MLPIPLHPALVHFPIVFVVLMPIVAGITLWAIRRGSRPARVWLAPLALAVALSGSAWLAVETGKDQEERVEKVVSETVLDVHAPIVDGGRRVTTTREEPRVARAGGRRRHHASRHAISSPLERPQRPQRLLGRWRVTARDGA